jgi:hypothetical protein
MADNSKINLRNKAKLLTNLPPGVRNRLEAAFGEAEDLLDLHNTSNIDSQAKRVNLNTVDVPQVTITTNSLGFDIIWPKIKNRRITMYEVQIATTENFAAPITYTTVDNFFAIEGAATVTYARVRAVKWNGEVSRWSETKTISVGLSAVGPALYTSNLGDMTLFYRNYPGLAFPSPIAEMSIVPARKSGGMVFFGSFGVEFYVDGNGFRGDHGQLFYLGAIKNLEDEIKATINGKIVSNISQVPCFLQAIGGFEQGYGGGTAWSPKVSPPQASVFGYSVAFGPGFMQHSEFYVAQHGPNYAGSVDKYNDRVRVSPSVHDPRWGPRQNPAGKRVIFDGVHDTSGTYQMSAIFPSSLPAGTYERTDTLYTLNHKLLVPAHETITGIGLDIYHTGSSIDLNLPQVYRIQLYDPQTGLRPTIKGAGTAILGGVDTYQTYGGPGDLWGEAPGFWTASKINSNNFGVEVQYDFTNDAAGQQQTQVSIYGLEFTIYTNKGQGRETADIKVVYNPATQDFYSYPYRRARVTNCTLNVLEFGVSR